MYECRYVCMYASVCMYVCTICMYALHVYFVRMYVCMYVFGEVAAWFCGGESSSLHALCIAALMHLEMIGHDFGAEDLRRRPAMKILMFIGLCVGAAIFAGLAYWA